jgi:CDGSH-type Zn-finger protein/uncharacterized Fe-S cluster protein YjdI
MAGDKIHRFQADDIEVSYSLKRCIHAEECVKRLAAVFDKNQRPWIQPANAPADAIAATIEHCPTGALHYARKDGGTPEIPAPEATIQLAPDGPLYVRGAITLKASDGTVLMEETRLALCRCGASKNKPFCDNSHRQIGFKTDDHAAGTDEADSGVHDLTITSRRNGPYHIEGDFVMSSSDHEIFRGNDAWLCRCGGSNNQPFCDTTHTKNGFDAP